MRDLIKNTILNNKSEDDKSEWYLVMHPKIRNDFFPEEKQFMNCEIILSLVMPFDKFILAEKSTWDFNLKLHNLINKQVDEYCSLDVTKTPILKGIINP